MTPDNARAVRERPILFSAPMVRAIMGGAKFQTRRIVKWPRIPDWHDDDYDEPFFVRDGEPRYAFRTPDLRKDIDAPVHCPYGVPGDILAIKEATWMWCERIPNGKTKTGRQKWLYVPVRSVPLVYVADHPEKPVPGDGWVEHAKKNDLTCCWRYKSARFMPAWAVRTRVELTDVRVQRVQDISEEDARAEGIERKEMNDGRTVYFVADGVWTTDPVASFRCLWDGINAARGHGWEKNEWVWALTFRRVEQGEGSR